MDKKEYELIEHTADIGIRVKGKNLRELFSKTALALFDILAERKPRAFRATKTIKITLAAGSRDELFIAWLNELLSLAYAKEIIFTGFTISKLTGTFIDATAAFETMRHYRLNTEIKAATYHDLKLIKIAAGWQAEVLLDV